MALFKRFFYRKPPDRLLEITERVFVFDCCFSSDVMEADAYKTYIGGIVPQLRDYSPDSSFMVINFKEASEKPTQISEILPNYNIKLMEYPWEYEGCPVLPFEMINDFLNSSDSWLNSTGQKDVLLMHCERGGWPVLSFMLAGLLLCRKQYTGEQKTLEMVYKQAPRELLHILSPLNPQPSQLRYLQYVTKKNLGLEWKPEEAPLAKDLDCLKLKSLPLIGGKGCRPIIRIYGHDPLSTASSKSSKLLFSTSKVKNHFRCYRLNECQQVKLDIHCRVEGDVVLECVHLHDDYVKEDMLFRVVFHVSFMGSNSLELSREEFDLRWDASDQMPQEFRGEVLFVDVDPPTNGSDGNISDEFFEVEDDNNSAFEVEPQLVEDVDLKPGIVKDVDLKLPEVKDVDLKSDGVVEEIKVYEGKEENEKVKKEENQPQQPTQPHAPPQRQPPPPPPQLDQQPPQNLPAPQPEQPSPPQQPPNPQSELPLPQPQPTQAQQPQAQPPQPEPPQPQSQQQPKQQPELPQPPQAQAQQQPQESPQPQPPLSQDPPKPQPQESPQSQEPSKPQPQEPPKPQPQESPQSQEPPQPQQPPQSQEQPKPQQEPPPQQPQPPQAQAKQPQESPQPQPQLAEQPTQP